MTVLMLIGAWAIFLLLAFFRASIWSWLLAMSGNKEKDPCVILAII